MPRKKKESNYAFIDSQNLNLGVQGLGWRLDFGKFRRYLKDKYRVTKAYLFIGYIKSNQRLYDYLERTGYELVFKPVVLSGTGPKGNVDAELILHTLHELYEANYDQAVIVTGDGDFHCLVEYLVDRKRLKKLIVPNQYKYSSLLRKYRDKGMIDFLNPRKDMLKRGK